MLWDNKYIYFSTCVNNFHLIHIFIDFHHHENVKNSSSLLQTEYNDVILKLLERLENSFIPSLLYHI